jgi:hypothetical protein
MFSVEPLSFDSKLRATRREGGERVWVLSVRESELWPEMELEKEPDLTIRDASDARHVTTGVSNKLIEYTWSSEDRKE